MSYLMFEAWARVKNLRSWDRYLAIGEWFGGKVVRNLPKLVRCDSEHPVVFAYSYSASGIFPTAKKLGCRTVLGQIDPGIEEERILIELYQRAGLRPFPVAPKEYWDKWRFECELSDIIMVNSEWSHQCLVKAGIEESKIRIVELAYERLDPIREESGSLPDEFTDARPLRILFLGQVIARKGMLELAKAIELLRNEPVEWTIVGGGDLDDNQLFHSNPSVRRMKQVSRHQVEQYYSQADLFILPTHSDGYAITLLEAASLGLPIISSRNCGQVVKHMENGCVLEAVTPDAICKVVRHLMENPWEISRMRQNQLQRRLRTIDDLGSDLASLFA
jgi:glycosyltransferase involved in cell wall biosynthesis